MKLITTENFELKVADEALLVRPIRKLWNMDRSKGKETFYKQMSILFFVYDPSSNYAYISDEKERLAEVLQQEGISEFHNTAEFKDAVAAYKKLTKTPSTELLADVRLTVDKMRQALTSIDFDDLDEKDKVSAINTVAAVVSKMPKLIKDLSEAERAVTKELEEQGSTRGSQELTVGDLGFD
jgi:transcriptional regulator with GAF, ATPase, and Fis domain